MSNNILNKSDQRTFGDAYIKELIKVIRAEGKDSSGKLVRSIDYRLKDTVRDISILIESEKYLNYIDEGRKPGTYPNISDLKKWASVNNISQDAVFPIAKSIYEFGIKPTNIFNRTETNVLNGRAFDELEDNIADNIEEDLFNNFNN
ncbi:MAG: Unknown protein [uncultured Sulfurovum sp.]|uniref:Uncharacterized protein n=1 Tax=uncultured Sulfurovum sp. TaxID=269237 RepID=A0A6S6T5I9_9BACT|nr:MAG: Unknown protein [uncultured Sulfurovum sp.]